LNTVVVKSVDEDLVRRSMDSLARRWFEEHPEVEEIVVFGSFVAGNYSPGSDLDVLVVLTSSSLSIRDRIPVFMPDAFPVPVDIFPFTSEEIAARQSSPVLDDANRSAWRYRRKPANPA